MSAPAWRSPTAHVQSRPGSAPYRAACAKPPRRVHRPCGNGKLISLLLPYIEQYDVGMIVLGDPINMDGSHGPRAAHAEKFAQELRHLLGETVPVATLDERMTTMAASRYLNETDTRGAKRKGVIDTLSAQIILQNALDRLRHMAASEN